MHFKNKTSIRILSTSLLYNNCESLLSFLRVMALLIQVCFKSYQRINCVENYNFKCFSRENKSTPSFLMFAHPFNKFSFLGYENIILTSLKDKYAYKIKRTRDFKDKVVGDFGGD